MKRFMTLLLAIPLFAISYLHVDGTSSGTFTVPETVDITCDVSIPGNLVMFKVYLDQDGDGELDENDLLIRYFGMIEGVPSMGDVSAEEYIAGDDDSLTNGAILHSTYFGAEDFSFTSGLDAGITMFIEARDFDGTEASASIVLVPGELPDPVLPYICGHILEEGTSDGIENVYVFVQDEDNEYVGKTDSDGYYRVGVPSAGSYVIGGVLALEGTFSSLSDVSDTIIVADMDSAVYDGQLHRFDSVIRGRVVAEGEGVPQQVVYAVPMTYETFAVGMTDEDGNYVLGADSGNNYIVGVSFDDEPEYAMVTVTVSEVADIDFELTLLPNYIEGHLFRSDGETPIPGIYISAVGDEGIFESSTKEDGSYRVYVTPGTYIVRADFSLTVLPENYRVTVGDSAISGCDFAVESGLDLPDVSGSVLDTDESPVADAYVIIQPEDEENIMEWRYTTTDAEGSYLFADLMPGYALIGTYKAGYSEPVPEIIELDVIFGADHTGNDFTMMMEGIKERVARGFEISGAYPNPFNPVTNIDVSGSDSRLKLSVFDEQGRLVETSEKNVSGSSSFRFDGSDLPSGTYMYIIVDEDGKEQSGKMILVK